MRRVVLFVLTNLLVITMVAIVVRVFNLDRFTTEYGINYVSLLIFSGVIGFGGAFISLAMSRVLAKWAMGVKVLKPDALLSPDASWLLNTTYDLSRRAGLNTMPEVGIYQSPEANAFATGPTKSRALVAVSSGLLSSMPRDEVEAVLAHEVSHIVNGDMVTMTLLQGIINTFVIFLSRIIAFFVSRLVREELGTLVYFLVSIVLQIGLSILGMMVVMAYSRAREYRADAGAAGLAGRDKMIRALDRLKTIKVIDKRAPALQTMKISNPGGVMKLFSSHPSAEERIARLRALV
jgi:heat shock protein HtpX